MRRIALLVPLVLAACGGDVAPGKRAVMELLVDPDSAQWRNVAAYQVGAFALVCGEVNFKNRMGGYVGYTNFVAHEGTARIGELLPLELRIESCCSVAKEATRAGGDGISVQEAERAVRDVCSDLRL